uniref:Selenoprotein K n=1 Tax=Megaselia scalaris TaxID=36166 RepID=T1GZV9_MEGSC
MVYIGRDGKVYDKQPYNLDWFLGLFIGFWNFLCFFSLLAPLFPDSSSGSGNNRRWGGGGGGSTGGGGGPGKPGGNRKIGRITTISDCTVPGGG